MKLSPEVQERIERCECFEAIRTRIVLSLEGCEHPEHFEPMLTEIAQTLRMELREMRRLLKDIETLSCDAGRMAEADNGRTARIGSARFARHAYG